MKIRGFIGVVIVLLVGVGLTIAFFARDHDHGVVLSPDCGHVDTAMRAWGRQVRDIQRTLAFGVGSPGFGQPPSPAALRESTAKAAADVRTQTALVESATLRDHLADLATGLDLISRSRVGVTDPAIQPNKDFFAGHDQTLAAAYELKRACPDIGDPSPPGMPVRPSS